jgi:ABC-type dipeptide/oligopeptide/nickel transport system permease subunit
VLGLSGLKLIDVPGTSIAIVCILGVGMTALLVYLGRHSWVRYARGLNGKVVAVPEAGVGSESA